MVGQPIKTRDMQKPWVGLSQFQSKTADLKKLWELLESEVADETKATEAFHQIVGAIEHYKFTTPVVRDKDNNEFESSIGKAEIRRELKDVEKAITSLQSRVSRLSLQAKQVLLSSEGPLARRTSTGGKKFAHLLNDLMVAARSASGVIDAIPDKPTDHARPILAYDIAVAILAMHGGDKKKGPKATRPNPNLTYARGGALYGRVLAISLTIAGVERFSLGRLIDDGLYLLENPDHVRGDKAE